MISIDNEGKVLTILLGTSHKAFENVNQSISLEPLIENSNHK